MGVKEELVWKRRNPIIKMCVLKARRIRKVLEAICPDLSPNTITTVCVDLGDFWEIRERHRQRVREIERMSKRSDRRRLARLLTDLCYTDLIAHLPYHTRSMKRTLPRVIERLETKIPKRRK